MVNWKGALVLAVLAIGLGVYLFQSRPPARPAGASSPVFFGCTAADAVALSLVREDGRRLQLERSAGSGGWTITTAPPGPATDAGVDGLVTELHTLTPSDRVENPPAGADYGFEHPHLEVTCRVAANVSFNLSVGKQSFDGSSRYARLGGDAKVYVLSGAEVDRLDQFLVQPPYRPSPIPSGPSPSPTT